MRERISLSLERLAWLLLVLPLRFRRRIVTKGRLIRKSRKGSLDGKEFYVKWKVFPLEQMKGFHLQRKMHDECEH